tara:strand:+ start:1114 stop:2505 length:1392 start_codon:yes stop_codon:yes gene_type:complete
VNSLLDRVTGRHEGTGKGADPIADVLAQSTQTVTAAGGHNNPDEKPFRVLVLDGGGINGMAQVKALAELEKRTGKPASEHFDFIVGTSTGGLIALALAAPHPTDPNRPLMSAQELVEFYEKKGPEIFGTRNRADRGADWDEKPLEDFLKSKFGNLRMQESRIPVMVSAFDSKRGDAIWLRNLGPVSGKQHDANPYMWQAARATSAAPTKFKPAKVDMGEGQEPRYRNLIDGGVFANMPAMEAFLTADRMAAEVGKPNNIEMLSIGTDQKPFTMTAAQIAAKTSFGWAVDVLKGKSPIREVAERGKESSADRLLADRMGELYHRWDIPLQHSHGKKFSPSGKLDDASARNIAKLEMAADDFVHDNWSRVEALADRLNPGRAPMDKPAEKPSQADLRAKLDAVDPPSPGLLAILGFGRKNATVLASGPQAKSRRKLLESTASPTVIATANDRDNRDRPIAPPVPA